MAAEPLLSHQLHSKGASAQSGAWGAGRLLPGTPPPTPGPGEAGRGRRSQMGARPAWHSCWEPVAGLLFGDVCFASQVPAFCGRDDIRPCARPGPPRCSPRPRAWTAVPLPFPPPWARRGGTPVAWPGSGPVPPRCHLQAAPARPTHSGPCLQDQTPRVPLISLFWVPLPLSKPSLARPAGVACRIGTERRRSPPGARNTPALHTCYLL